MPYNLDFSHLTPQPAPNAPEFILWALRSYREYCIATNTEESVSSLTQFLFAAAQVAIHADQLHREQIPPEYNPNSATVLFTDEFDPDEDELIDFTPDEEQA